MTDRSQSRRVFLGAAVVAAGGVAAAAARLSQHSAPSHPASAARSRTRRPTGRTTAAENSLPGDPHWPISHVGPADAIMGYAGRASVLAGESVPLFVSTTARSFRVLAFRMGWYNGALARLVWQSGHVRGHRQPPPTVEHPTNTVTTAWDPSLSVPTHDWPDGSYLLRLDAGSGAQRYVPLTIRSTSTAGRVVIKNAVATWQAYNTWGGYDLYNGPGGPADYNNRSLAVSLDRPYDLDGAYLFLAQERKLIQLAERLGLPLAYVTSMDLDENPGLLRGASALISPGHDEYWSPPERAHVTAARDAGVNVAFFGANACFRRTRLASTRLGPRRLIICYKTSYTLDPMYGKDSALVTSDWREPPNPDPESSLTGTLYESNPTSAAFVVASPSAWLFRHTGVHQGTAFPGLVGIEYDRVNPDSPIERPVEILSHSPLTCRGVHSYSDSAYYTHRGGAGVFNTGTLRWVRSLSGNAGFGITRRASLFTRQVTTNVLRAFAAGPAAGRYPAHDNLTQMHEWAGDPISAQHNLW
jgi:hypothetical protein